MPEQNRFAALSTGGDDEKEVSFKNISITSMNPCADNIVQNALSGIPERQEREKDLKKDIFKAIVTAMVPLVKMTIACINDNNNNKG